MTLRLDDRWVWDFWFAEDGEDVHVFYLQAPRALGDPNRRHRHARLGHAVSRDLRDWTVLPDPLEAGPAGAFDDLATWTGSILKRGATWYLVYTGVSSRESGRVQRIGVATSTDLVRFDRCGGGEPILTADPRWYELDASGPFGAVAWRDPFVIADPAGDGYHALITARRREGLPASRGVIGHAVSPDLRRWEARPPLAGPEGFAELEVPQVVDLGGDSLLVFCTAAIHVSDERRTSSGVAGPTGTYVCRGPGPLGPFDGPLSEPMRPVTELYAGKLIRRGAEWFLLGFHDLVDGTFVGALSDPMPFDVTASRREPAPPRARPVANP